MKAISHWNWWQQNMLREAYGFEELGVKTASCDTATYWHTDCHCTFSSFICYPLKQSNKHRHHRGVIALRVLGLYDVICVHSRFIFSPAKWHIDAELCRVKWSSSSSLLPQCWRSVRGWRVSGLQGHIPLNRLPSFSSPSFISFLRCSLSLFPCSAPSSHLF